MPRQRSRLTGPTRPRSRPYLHCPTGASEGRGTPSRADEPGAARYPSRSNRRHEHVQRILARLLGYAAGLPQVANETLEPRPVADSDSHGALSASFFRPDPDGGVVVIPKPSRPTTAEVLVRWAHRT